MGGESWLLVSSLHPAIELESISLEDRFPTGSMTAYEPVIRRIT